MIEKLRKLARTNKQAELVIYGGYLANEKFNQLLFLFMRALPIQPNKIVFCAMQGDRYGDNPYYISEALRSRQDLEIVWLLDPEAEAEGFPEEFRRVDARNPVLAARELATAKVWVDCAMKRTGFLKRRGQLYIQTWHGSYGIKKIGMDVGERTTRIERRTIRYNAKYEDVLLSNSRRTTEIYRRAFLFDKRVIEKGSPRNDMLLEDPEKYREKVDAHFRLRGARVILYAPTFRNDYGTDALRLDFERLIRSLEEATGEKWAALVRLHYLNLKAAEGFIRYSDRILNASAYDDMQELLAASDILVTDYSSCMFDFATTRKPCFLYAADLEKYDSERGNYFRIEELPFPLARTQEELEENIRHFDEAGYQSGLDRLFAEVGLRETGHAGRTAARYILRWMERH